jgi:iron complex outermembrane receptor protein
MTANHRPSHLSSNRLTQSTHWLAFLGLVCALPSEAQILEEIIVRAALQSDDSARTSLTILNSPQIEARNAQHIEAILSAAPNTNFASGASRGRFFQIRGIGERSQFVEPVNASVATLIDGIDITGIGGAATLLDLEQVEILRGPQGTLFGANALAGLIALHSVAPSNDIEAQLKLGLSNYGGRDATLILGDQLSEAWSGRLSIESVRNDGFMRNRWLGRDDTNGIDETTARAQLRWQSASQSIDLGLYHVDVDNGYDAFSLDNTRETLSDEPGRDALELLAWRARYEKQFAQKLLSAQLSGARSDTRYAYDEDWSYVGIAPGWEYSSVDDYRRDRDMLSLDLRLARSEQDNEPVTWVLGTYLRDENERLARQWTYLDNPFHSDLGIETVAFYGQIDVLLNERWSTALGGRIEERRWDYRDNAGVRSQKASHYSSGKLSLNWDASSHQQLFASISLGVRAGGVNAGLLASLDGIPAASRDQYAPLGFFDQESLVSYELGWRYTGLGGALRSGMTLFSMQRKDQQAKGSLVVPREDGSTAFIDYTDNAARGQNRGLEWTLNYQVTQSLNWRFALGLLDAHFDRYVTADGDDLRGRDQPQAPRWQFQTALGYVFSDRWHGAIELTGKDRYFFSDRHFVSSQTRHLINAHVIWHAHHWSAKLWARNLTDETYFVRGFGTFGNDPRKEYVTEPYLQYGEPRMLGLSITYDMY